MGQLVRFKLAYNQQEEGAPLSLIAKLPAQERKNRLIADSMMLYENENRVYETILPSLPLRTPRCYFSDMDPGPAERKIRFLQDLVERMPKFLANVTLGAYLLYTLVRNRRYVLLIEDLSNYDYIDQRDGCSFEDAKLVMNLLGAAQSAFWEDDRLDQFWLRPIAELSNLTYSLFKSALPVFKKYFWNIISKKERLIVEWLADHHYELDRYIAARPTTLVHGDFRLDNIFFDREQNEIAVIDWSGVKKGPAVYDAAYFNLGTGNAPHTPDQVKELASIYYQGLIQGGVSGYSFTDFLTDYTHMQLNAYKATIVIIGSLEMDNDPDLLNLTTLWVERMGSQFQDIDLSSLLNPPA
jgi:hypothetical protein